MAEGHVPAESGGCSPSRDLHQLRIWFFGSCCVQVQRGRAGPWGGATASARSPGALRGGQLGG